MKRDLKIWAVILGIVIVGMGITKFTDAYVSNKRTQMDIAGLARTEAESAGEEAAEEEPGPGGPLSSGALDGAAAYGGQDAGDGDMEGALEGEPEAARTALTAENGAEMADSASPDRAAAPGQGMQQEMQKKEVAADITDTMDMEAMGAADMREGIPEGTLTGGADGVPTPGPGSTESDKGGGPTAEDYRDQLEDYLYRLPELDAQIQRMRSAETENTVQSVKSAAKTEQRIWERELEAVYSLLITSLDEEAADTLRTEQQTWIIERDITAQAASKKNSGSIENVEYTASIAASTRERVYELVEAYR